LETSQNRKFSIRALGTDIGCKRFVNRAGGVPSVNFGLVGEKNDGVERKHGKTEDDTGQDECAANDDPNEFASMLTPSSALDLIWGFIFT
jgi:hypothetical protein